MRAVVVYESLWGNTAAVARAVADGIGGDTACLPTGEATPEVLEGIDLLVVGSPVLGFRLPTNMIRGQIGKDPKHRDRPPDLSQPSMRDWLARQPSWSAGAPAAAAFETRIWWSPGGSAGAIESGLRKRGCRIIDKAGKFVVTGNYGPLRDGELERARAWGAALAERAARA